MVSWVAATVEGWMGLEVKRGKTRTVWLRDPGASLDVLGYTFRYERDHYGRSHRFLNMVPRAKACGRQREAICSPGERERVWSPESL